MMVQAPLSPRIPQVHYLILYPYVQILIAILVLEVWQKFKAISRALFLFFIIFVSLELGTWLLYFRNMERMGTVQLYTNTVYALSDWMLLHRRPLVPVVFFHWELPTNVELIQLDNKISDLRLDARIVTFSPQRPFRGDVVHQFRRLSESWEHGFYFVHEVFPLSASHKELFYAVRQWAIDNGKECRLEREFFDRDGSLVYQVYFAKT